MFAWAVWYVPKRRNEERSTGGTVTTQTFLTGSNNVIVVGIALLPVATA